MERRGDFRQNLPVPHHVRASIAPLHIDKRKIKIKNGTPTKRQVSKRPVAKKHPYVLVVGGNPQVLLQLCLQAK